MKRKHELSIFIWRNCISHLAAYLFAGALCSTLIDYESLLGKGNLKLLMRPFDSPMVPLGLILQPVNAIPLAFVLYGLRDKLITEKGGWKQLFLLSAGYSLFAPQAPGVGTFEGFIYTRFTIEEHLLGLPETLIYSLLFGIFLYGWYQKPKRVYNQAAVGLLIVVSLISILGYLNTIGALPKG